MDLPVNTGAVRTKSQKSRAMQQRLEVQVGAFADQFEFDFVGLIQRFPDVEFEYLKVVGKTFNVEFENDLPGIAEHPHVPVSVIGTGLCVDLPIGAVRRFDT
jgi:hypothetical protein